MSLQSAPIFMNPQNTGGESHTPLLDPSKHRLDHSLAPLVHGLSGRRLQPLPHLPDHAAAPLGKSLCSALSRARRRTLLGRHCGRAVPSVARQPHLCRGADHR